MSIILIGFLASLAAGSATGLGAVPLLFLRKVSSRLQNGLLGFAAGVMLAASFFSLILPALETGAGPAVVGAGILLGATCLWALDLLTPHEHFVKGRQGPETDAFRRIWLFVIAITLHNIPEGLAVGVGFGTGSTATGFPLAFGIGLQNMPEGLAVAVALHSIGYQRGKAVAIALATGLVEPLGALVGLLAVSLAAPLLPWGLAFAAGAMIFVVSNEIIPETHRAGLEKAASVGLMLGFVIMLYLDVSLG
ncbi:ZIP family metal transporter [Skermanella sp. TT6]|uniref:ZIP family metal transporter n=1 Tax=Skermanella cutis TaxID=2775420 RepID=UPI001FFEF5EC|nr:ZIP family metal transporter [Skermanella sp. TT6]